MFSLLCVQRPRVGINTPSHEDGRRPFQHGNVHNVPIQNKRLLDCPWKESLVKIRNHNVPIQWRGCWAMNKSKQEH